MKLSPSILAVAGVAAISAFLTLQAVSLGSKECYFDATCGRLRKVTNVLGVTIHNDVEETALSQKFRALVGEPGPPEWRLVFRNTSNGMHEDWFGSGYSEAKVLTLTLEMGEFTDEAERALLVWFFDAIKDRKRLSQLYDDYSRALHAVIDEKDKAGARIAVADLPPFPGGAAKAQ
jgi:hypothetical protein